MIVSLKVAKFLKNRFDYNLPSLYVYDGEEQRFSLEPCHNPIPAPSIIEAVEFLWKTGLKIYGVPEDERTRGIIKVGNREVRMKETGQTLTESYSQCLEFLIDGLDR